MWSGGVTWSTTQRSEARGETEARRGLRAEEGEGADRWVRSGSGLGESARCGRAGRAGQSGAHACGGMGRGCGPRGERKRAGWGGENWAGGLGLGWDAGFCYGFSFSIPYFLFQTLLKPN